MGSENSNPIEELKALDRQIGETTNLAQLKPIFYRLEEIARENAADFDVQLAYSDVKQKVIQRGTLLKQQGDPSSTTASSIPAIPTPPELRTPGTSGSPEGPPSPPPAAGPGSPPAMPSATMMTSAPPPPLPGAGAGQTPGKPGQAPPASGPGTSAGAPLKASGTPPKGAVAGGALAASSRSSGAGGAPPRPPADGPPASREGNWKRAIWMGIAAGLVLSAIMLGVIWSYRGGGEADVATFQAQITTIPAGAAITINGTPETEPLECVADCAVDLPAGQYQVSATLAGYEPTASLLTVADGQPPRLDLTLTPQPQVLRVLADLDQGQVFLDDQQVGELEGGSFYLEDLEPGPHTVRVTSGNFRASFGFDAAEASMPVIREDIETRDLLAVVVASFNARARVATSSGPLKLRVNDLDEDDAIPEGVNMASFLPGLNTFVVGEGREERTIRESFDARPTLTAFLESDRNIGTLIVATGVDDAQVFLNGREYPARTRRGQLRIQTIGPVTVRVAKDGFRPVEEKSTTITKGSATRLEFAMEPLPEFSSLVIQGGSPRAGVWIDSRSVGAVGPDGIFRNSSVQPGMRLVELRMDGFTDKRFELEFPAGETVTISGQDALLARIPPPPAPPKPVVPPPAPPPKPVIEEIPQVVMGGMQDFEQPQAWRIEGGIARHRGEAFLLYGLRPDGTFTFTIHLLRGGSIFRAGRVRWFARYVDANNYLMFELDHNKLWSKPVINGQTQDRREIEHGLDGDLKQWTMQVDISPGALVTRIRRNGAWVTLDNWSEPGVDFTAGKFGILIRGGDETGLSDFQFQGH